MTNHENRSTRAYQFIAYSMVTLNSLACGRTAQDAMQAALEATRPYPINQPMSEAVETQMAFLEILDCGAAGRKTWNDSILLNAARKQFKTVHRGDGFASDFPAVDLT